MDTGFTLIHKTSCDSTNRVAIRALDAHTALPFLVLADGQTHGQGTHGRRFYSPSGSGLYLSVVVPDDASFTPAQTTMTAAVAAVDAIAAWCGRMLSIKWINDLIWRDHKAGGILSVRHGDALIVGVGINLWTSSFPGTLAATATSVLDAPPDADDRVALAYGVGRAFLARRRLGPANAVARYRERLIRGLVQVQTIDRNERAEIVDVRDDGVLLMRDSHGCPFTLSEGTLWLPTTTPAPKNL